jgi:DNA-binding MarR family transcriptional regulator
MVGAVADELSGAMDAAVFAETGLRGEGAAAITALYNTPGLSVKELARFLGMRSPSAVQLVDRLESSGLMQRRPGPDARTRSLGLTASGRRKALQVFAARKDIVAARLKSLSSEQRDALTSALTTMLASMRSLAVDLDHLCRRCDESVCRPALCPVGCELKTVEQTGPSDLR